MGETRAPLLFCHCHVPRRGDKDSSAACDREEVGEEEEEVGEEEEPLSRVGP